MTRNPQRSRSDQAGFTLIEVLIAMVLLVVISLSIYQATTATYRLRDSLLTDGDFINGIRLTMGLMDRDIAQIYTPLLGLPNTVTQAGPGVPGAPLTATDDPTEFWGSPRGALGVRPARFVGTDSKITFVSISHTRTFKDAPESDFNKVIYELQTLRALADTKEGRVLTRITSTNAFDDEDKDRDKLRKVYPLLPGVTQLKFTYYKKVQGELKSTNTWDSTKPEQLDQFPDYIDLAIEVRGEPRKFFEGTYRFKPEIPLSGISASF